MGYIKANNFTIYLAIKNVFEGELRMKLLSSVDEIMNHIDGVITVNGGLLIVEVEAALPAIMDDLAYTAVFGEGLTRDTARWIIWETAQDVGIHLSSIHELYLAVGRGELPANFTVPAMNVRAINYYTSRAIFRAANKHNVGTMLFEIARSEMGYTHQRPAEYVSGVLAAAIKEGYRGPVFVQGDHFQISASNYAKDAEAEVQSVKDLASEAIASGFYNIDIDTSTLVNLDHKSLLDQQKLNYERCMEITEHIRSIEPNGITISLGGEIGEVGHKNSTVEELDAFMQGYNGMLPEGMEGLSKISVNTGTSHGGVVLPDGTLAQVNVAFDTLGELSESARADHGLGGAVQHGASTLPQDAFTKFPEVGTLEIHLATNFVNIVFDLIPESLLKEMYAYLEKEHAGKKKDGQTIEQFYYKERKRALGVFKEQWWHFDDELMATVTTALQETFERLFVMLNVVNTRRMATNVTTMISVHKSRPTDGAEEAVIEAAADLND